MVAATKPTSLRDSLFTPEALGQQPLPPSERDFEVFETLTFHGENTRSTAELFGISQTRVLQIRDRVADWLGSCGPVMTRLAPEQRVHLAARMAELRLDFLYCQAMAGFRYSQGEQRRTRTTPHGDTIVTVAESGGDIRYLDIAMRITDRTLAVAVKAANALGLKGRGQEAGIGDREGEAPAEPWVQGSGFGVQEELQDLNPPVRDCSENEADSGNGHAAAATAIDATDCQDEVCDELENRRREFLAALHDDQAPVHPPFTDAGGMLLDSSEMLSANGNASATAVLDRPAAAPSRPLSRKERRARQRLLERKLRKAK